MRCTDGLVNHGLTRIFTDLAMLISLELGPEMQRTMTSMTSMGQAVAEGCSRGLALAVELAATNVGKNFMTGQLLKARTGNLRKAVQGWKESAFEGVVGVRPGSAVEKYSWILGDQTKTIKPTRGRLLAIPIGDNLTGSGVAKKSSPRDFPGGWFQLVGGRLFFVERKGKTERSGLRILFLMLPSVTVKGSDALAKGVLDAVDQMNDAMNGCVSDAIDKA
jgi:hypothetical protein